MLRSFRNPGVEVYSVGVLSGGSKRAPRSSSASYPPTQNTFMHTSFNATYTYNTTYIHNIECLHIMSQ